MVHTPSLRRGLILAGTGHRPPRLGGYGDATRDKLGILASNVISRLAPVYGYCGGALGWDTAWGMALMGAGIPYCMALPSPDMGKSWPARDKGILAILIENADKVKYLSDRYSIGAYTKRDRYMVSQAEGVVAILDPTMTDSGTYRACQHAKSLNLPVLNLWDACISLLTARP